MLLHLLRLLEQGQCERLLRSRLPDPRPRQGGDLRAPRGHCPEPGPDLPLRGQLLTTLSTHRSLAREGGLLRSPLWQKLSPITRTRPSRLRLRQRRRDHGKDSSISAASLAAGLKAAAPAKIQVEERASSAVPSAEAPKKRPRIRTVSLGGEPKGEFAVTLPIARKDRPRKTANVTLPTAGSFMPIRRPKGQPHRSGVPYGARNQMLAAEGKQLIDESNEFLNARA